MPDSFDEQALMDRLDGDIEFLEETVEMLEEDCPTLIDNVRRAVEAGDAAALVEPAHTLKGMFSNFCAAPAEAAARELEFKGRQNQLANASAATQSLQREAEQLQAALHSFIEAKKS